ncbi:MAG: 16S rRNA (guanine(966)-N(2))-methyltransferase RsmD [Rhodospirillaceae bacterium]|nr:16S rRNA (guanine(966)-N(2))-methyltransferase RsmD [Rhodospirillaceae bacterium]MBT7361499.1 16S rRNA (guanine(966)-N(2))-methyltransferase RsmD [Rhodospirillaceae bacterium]
MKSQAGRLRIIGGSHRGRRIEIPPGSDARPTGDRVREALFSILASGIGNAHGLDGAHVLDACAGSGALGIEALSRGAAHAVFFDIDRPARVQISVNLDALELSDRADVHRTGDATKPPAGTPCDIVFLDPPYDSEVAQTAPAALAESGWITPGGLVVIETRRGTEIDCEPGFEIVDTRSYGDTSLHFVVWKS